MAFVQYHGVQHGGRVMIIEDDTDIREALTQILEEEGYHVTGAKNGRDAIDHLRAADLPSLILLDLMMPVMNGWQFRSEQSQDPALADIPVVIISADGNVHQKVAAIGVQGYLKKPIDLNVLLGTVKRYCNPS